MTKVDFIPDGSIETNEHETDKVQVYKAVEIEIL